MAQGGYDRLPDFEEEVENAPDPTDNDDDDDNN